MGVIGVVVYTTLSASGAFGRIGLLVYETENTHHEHVMETL